MAASNSTPIQLYYSNTAGSVPLSTSLITGELAINVPDGIIFYKDASNNVNVIARTSAAAGRFANVTFGDGSIQYKSAAPWAYTNSIHALANTAITDIIYLQGVNQSQNNVVANTQIYANGSFGRANASYDVANGSFTKANTAYENTLDLAGVNSTQNTNISLASSFANGAFGVANTNATAITNLQAVNVTQNTKTQISWDRANSAFDYANTIIATGGSVDSQAREYVNGAFLQANTNTTSITNIQGVNTTQNTTIQSAWDKANSAFDSANTIIATGASVDNRAREYANVAFDAANTNATSITNLQGVDTTQNTVITNVASYANGAFTKANNALANTSDITVTNNLTVPGQANVYNRLSVGTGSYQVLPNLIAQFTGTSEFYSQVNQQNLSANGTGDFVITADNGTDATNYTDMGMAGSTYDNTSINAFPMVQPNDGYFMVVGDAGAAFGGNVFIGTSGSGSFGDIVFIQGNDYAEVARFKAGDKIEFYRPVVANSFTTVDGINVVTHTNNANTYLKGLIDTKVSKSGDTISGALSINSTSTANALSVSGNVYISNDLRVSGNLYIGGNATSISANNLTLDDSIIYIANNNPSNVIDIGIAGAFNDGTYQHTGFVRDASDGKWKLFSNVISEPTTTINFTNAEYDTLKLGAVETDSITVSGLDLSAHTNSAFGKANSAYTLADGKVSSVSGTSGRISVSGTSNAVIDLVTSGVVAGSYTYPSLQVDSYGRVTTISTQTPVTSFNTRTGAVSLGSSDVTSALGYTPVDTVAYDNAWLAQSSLDASQNTRIVNVGSFANGAFFKANAAAIYANGAFTLANTTNELATNAGDFANGAFTLANTTNTLVTNAGDFANGAFVASNTTNALTVNAYNKANSVGSFANGAFTTANNAGSVANGAFTLANTTNELATNAGNFANGSFTYANTTNALTVNAYAKANNAGDFANGAFSMANTAYNTGGILVGSFANGAFSTANASFEKANNTGSFANGAFDRVNSAYEIANSALTIGGGLVGSFANGAYTTANAAFDKANVTYSLADAAFLRANVAFDTSNTNSTRITFTGTYANGAFTKANTVGEFANGSFTKANSAYELANDAYAYANTLVSSGTSIDSWVRNQANTVGEFANGAFTLANTTNTLATNAGNFANGAFALANTTASTLTLEQSYSNSAYTLANTNATSIANLQAVDNTQNTSIQASFIRANAAFDAANAEIIGTGAFARSNAGYELANTNATSIANMQGVDTWQNTYSQEIFTTANNAFDKANNSGDFANGAYTLANTTNTLATNASDVANGSFTTVNTVFELTNTVYEWANTVYSDFAYPASANTLSLAVVNSQQNTNISLASSFANGAFSRANAGYDVANVSFERTNSAFGAANTSLSYALSSFQKANSIVSPTYTTSDTPPSNPSTSAIWYNTTSDVMYQWVTSDGTNYYWIDIGSPTVTVGSTTISYTYTGYGRAAAHAMIFGGF